MTASTLPVAAMPNGLSADDAPALALDELEPPPVAQDANGTKAAAAKEPVIRVLRPNDLFSIDSPQFATGPCRSAGGPSGPSFWVMPSPLRPVEAMPRSLESILVAATGKEAGLVVIETMQLLIIALSG